MSSLNILTPLNSIAAKLKSALAEKVKNEELIEFRARIAGLKVKQFLMDRFINSETYRSLTSGELKGEFGLTNREAAKIPDILDDIIHVYVAPNKTKANGIFTITIGIGSPAEIDYNKHGVFITEKGEAIHWLWWLLTQGTQPLVSGYSFFLKQGIGRSEIGIMVASDGFDYYVDNYFAGVEGDNWISRTIREYKVEIQKILKESLNHAS